MHLRVGQEVRVTLWERQLPYAVAAPRGRIVAIRDPYVEILARATSGDPISFPYVHRSFIAPEEGVIA